MIWGVHVDLTPSYGHGDTGGFQVVLVILFFYGKDKCFLFLYFLGFTNIWSKVFGRPFFHGL